MIVSASINLVPSLVEWSRHGKPPNDFDKTAAQAEIYGLKLRQLLSPVQPSRIEALRALGEREREFPNENENSTTRMGTILSIGFVAMLAQFLFAARLPPHVRAAGALTLASVLLATVGGFGALFSLLVTPDIRAYNRIVVFVAFFTIVYLAHVCDTWIGRIRDDGRKRWADGASRLALGFVLLVGVLDEGQAARPVVGRYAIDAATFHAERAFVREIERRHPAGGAVMQLPETLLTPDVGRAKMQEYDHARAYLASDTLSWSWPSYSSRRQAWYESLGDPTGRAFLDRLSASGFVGVWIDRFGYEPSELAALEGALTARLGPPLVGGPQQRYAYFDLSSGR
jgi:phosphoglycerol transferase